MRSLAILALLCSLLLAAPASAQFGGGFFEQMFGGNQQQQQQPQNVPSDSGPYRQRYEQSHCDKYLCPDTLACVHFPHHCPCPWPANEDKFELSDGHRICVSKGGFKPGEAGRKVELMRKGLL